MPDHVRYKLFWHFYALGVRMRMSLVAMGSGGRRVKQSYVLIVLRPISYNCTILLVPRSTETSAVGM